jgi:hypothetical protein
MHAPQLATEPPVEVTQLAWHTSAGSAAMLDTATFMPQQAVGEISGLAAVIFWVDGCARRQTN